MNSTKQDILAELTASIHKRWGTQAIRRGSEVATVSPLSPLSLGFPKLDAILDGGILRGHITELCGTKTSGTATLALKTIASTQSLGEKVIYMDPAMSFNAKYASDLKVNLEDLLIVRPATATEGMEIATDLLRRYSAGLLVFGHTAAAIDDEGRSALRRLVNAVRRSSCAFIILNRAAPPATIPFHPYAATRLMLRRVRWVKRLGVVGGYLVRVNVMKLNGSDCHRSITLRFDLP